MVSVEYKKMSEDEKKKYDDMAAKDKERYTAEMKDYVPPSDDDDDDDDDNNGGGKKKVAKKKVKKDPNAPKKPMSAYLLFSTKMRASIKEEFPDMNFGDLARKIAERYKALPADEMEKLTEKAKEDKAKYMKVMAAYKQKQVAEAAENLDDDDDSDDSDSD